MTTAPTRASPGAPGPQPRFTRLVEGLPAAVPYVPPEALERRAGRQFQLRLGANESPFGISPRVREAVVASFDRLSWYGDSECWELREELAGLHRVGIEHVVVASGIDELLGLFVRLFVNPGDTAVTSRGGYPTFTYHVAGYGGRLEQVRYRDARNDLNGLAAAAARVRAPVVFLANPDNPTGTWRAARDVEELANGLPRGTTLLLDEAYIDFASPGTAPPIAVDNESIVRLRTFSKAHGLAGTRVGYAIAAADIVRTLDKIRLHFGVSRIAQTAALASLGDPGFVEGVAAAVAKGRREYEALARELGLEALPSATNFVAFDLGSFERAKAVRDQLLDRGVFVRMPGVPSLNRYVRVTVGSPEERREFAEVFRDVAGGVS